MILGRLSERAIPRGVSRRRRDGRGAGERRAMDSLGRTAGRDGARPADPRWVSSAGLKVLIPGYAQWSWRQRERGAVLFGSFATALVVAAFAWGTWVGLVVLAFAFGTHVVSVVDVVRQGSFPGFGRWMPLVSASGGLAVGVYS